MPRMSEAEKRKSNKRILDAAARLMRQRGVEATSVSDVMQAAGLTHGGFYRHFASKEDLVAAAFRQAVDEVVADVEKAPHGAARSNALDSYMSQYLSPRHLEDRGHGCPLAAMGSEVARLDGRAKGEASAAVRRMAALLAPEDGPTDQGFAMMALLLGTVTLARLAETREEGTAFLGAGREGIELLQRHWPD